MKLFNRHKPIEDPWGEGGRPPNHPWGDPAPGDEDPNAGRGIFGRIGAKAPGMYDRAREAAPGVASSLFHGSPLYGESDGNSRAGGLFRSMWEGSSLYD